jgi:hypothetical protein
MVRKLNESNDYKDYEVTVRFGGIGCEETYDLYARNDADAESSALFKAEEDLYADEVTHIEDDEYEATVNFNGFIGSEQTYTVYADSEDEAESLGIEAAVDDLEVIDVVEDDVVDLDSIED